MLKLLQKKYSLEFVIVSDIKDDTQQGIRYVSGKVAPAAEPARQADAWVDTHGSLGDNYSALGFKDQAETGMRSICATDGDLLSYTVILIAPQSSDRWDHLSFAEFMKSPGVQDSVHATLVSGLSEEVYAAQGWQLLNALYAPGLPFTLQAYDGDHMLFAENWVPGKPRNTTQQMLLDYIHMNRDAATPRYTG